MSKCISKLFLTLSLSSAVSFRTKLSSMLMAEQICIVTCYLHTECYAVCSAQYFKSWFVRKYMKLKILNATLEY